MNIFWMKYSPLESSVSATDPLGFDYLAQQLGYLPLPNFTGRTSRARYYSMVCYGIHVCEEAISRKGLLHNDETMMRMFEMYEKYWAYAVVMSYDGKIKERDNIESGLRGKRGAIKAFNGKITGLGSEYRLLSRQLELGALGAYRSSLERFGLINRSSLSLTLAGREMAESFLLVDKGMRKQYDELVIESIMDERIIEKKGRASIKMLGEYGRLDYYKQKPADTNERFVIRKYIIESEPATLTTARMVHEKKAVLKNDMMTGIRGLAFYESSELNERFIKDCFKTILEFELLTAQLNDMFCAILKTIFENGGMISSVEVEKVVQPFHMAIYEKELAKNLAGSPKYKDILGSYYGGELERLIYSINLELTSIQLVNAVLTMHREVEAKRKASSWLEQDGEILRAFSGYEYAKANVGRHHNYKISNLLSIMDDAGWLS